ncbi:ferrochelatase [Carboxylicivirga linearis]|uniref:Ferrochelatase n=1 Tax=Carboxylicivirga linearis TaxID=1628157 RepID=A0ABS5JS26_9BACT|nr:ferrochelatase [Carboxylicivirga linearis]MBS2097610.1 ferrochelatase [Carboxylicivirga linearis]
MSTTGILIVNLGTPDSYKRKDVKKYLAEFLMDGRVIDIPFWKRFLLVRGIIAPFRSRKVSVEYNKLWLENGSPLMVYGQQLVNKLQGLFNNDGDETVVELAMRYQSPSVESGLNKLKEKAVERIVVLPLFPQYASATVGSVAQKVMEIISKWEVIPSIEFINDYHDEPEYIKAFAQKVEADMQEKKPNHVLFSYHGIPERHLENIQKQNNKLCTWPNCQCEKENKVQRFCYRSACFNTTKLIAAETGLSEEKYTTSFQSRLGKSPWIKPYTDVTIEELAKKGIKNLLVVSPSFVADCLETTLEIGEQYKELFIENGGGEFNFTESLNADDKWAEAVYKMLVSKM